MPTALQIENSIYHKNPVYSALIDGTNSFINGFASKGFNTSFMIDSGAFEKWAATLTTEDREKAYAARQGFDVWQQYQEFLQEDTSRKKDYDFTTGKLTIEEVFERRANAWKNHLLDERNVGLANIETEADFKEWQKTHDHVSEEAWALKKHYDAKQWRILRNKHNDTDKPKDKKSPPTGTPLTREISELYTRDPQAFEANFKTWRGQNNDIPENAWRWKFAYEAEEKEKKEWKENKDKRKEMPKPTPVVFPTTPTATATTETPEGEPHTAPITPPVVSTNEPIAFESIATKFHKEALARRTAEQKAKEQNKAPSQTQMTGYGGMTIPGDTYTPPPAEPFQPRSDILQEPQQAPRVFYKIGNPLPPEEPEQEEQEDTTDDIEEENQDEQNNAPQNKQQQSQPNQQDLQQAEKNINRLKKLLRGGKGGGLASAGGEVAAGTSEFWGPVVGIGLFILFLIILILILILIPSKSNEFPLDVYLTKESSPKEVPNPTPGSPASNITYTLSSVYEGKADRIEIVDPIPENAEFVSATGNYTLERDAQGNVTKVVWRFEGTPTAADDETPVKVSGTPTKCNGTPVSFGAEKRFLPFPSENKLNSQEKCIDTVTQSCGRLEQCVSPQKIVMHTTAGPVNQTTAGEIYDYFAGGSANRGVGTHFAIGRDGEVLQFVETLADKVEVVYGVGGYSDPISIELLSTPVYNNKNEVPKPQYNAALTLVRKLMGRYNIPVGSWTTDQKAASDAFDASIPPGVYGHYQLNPEARASYPDPGAGMMKDFLADIKTLGPILPASKKMTPAGPVAVKTFNEGNIANKRIAITPDIGEGKAGAGTDLTDDKRANITTMLDILKKHNTKVTFFVTGMFLSNPANASIIERMKAEGHEFGNHTYDHASATGFSNGQPPLTEEAFVKELQDTQTAAQKVGITTKPYFRYPFLDDANYRNTLAQEGYYYIRLSCDTNDWKEDATTQKVLTVLTTDCKKPGAIALMHGYFPAGIGALDQALTNYEKDGYTVTTVSKVLEGMLP